LTATDTRAIQPVPAAEIILAHNRVVPQVEGVVSGSLDQIPPLAQEVRAEGLWGLGEHP
jgi:hypothetical protein